MSKQKITIKDRIVGFKKVPADSLEPHPLNWRTHPEAQRTALRATLAEIGFAGAILVREKKPGKYQIIDGHERQEEMGDKDVPILITDLTAGEAAKLLAVYDPIGAMAKQNSETLDKLLASLPTSGTNFQSLLDSMRVNSESLANKKAAAQKTLAERFIVPPFSVLDARQGYWQDRKRAWLDLGIESHLGRGANLLKMSETILEPDPEKRARKKGTLGATPPNEKDILKRSGKYAARTFGQDLMKGENPNFRESSALKDGLTFGTSIHPFDGTQERRDQRASGTLAPGRNGRSGPGDCIDGTPAGAGTSIFDPVLCELAYRWFCPDKGRVLDPFAGGSVRGIVAGYLGYKYVGIDLRQEQVDANLAQAAAMKIKGCDWKLGDSRESDAFGKDRYDLVFSCPPYFDLELYSEDPKDLSNAKSYKQFLEAYYQIVKNAVDRLADNRFACFVVGDLRDKDGFYRNFVSHTIDAFQLAGAVLYNEAILVTAVGSLPIRVGKQFANYRKLGKTHQNVLVFYKGKINQIPKAFPELELPSIAEQFGEEL